MGRYSDLAITLGIDVDGSVCERDLMRAPTGETPAQRWIRLAKLAIVRNCRLILVEDADPERNARATRVAVTSGTASDTVYRINLDTMRCECAADGPCSHLAYALACIGCLPIEPPHHVARSAAAARPISETLEVARGPRCQTCGDTGWVDAPSALTKDGTCRRMCPVCHPTVRLVKPSTRAAAA